MNVRRRRADVHKQLKYKKVRLSRQMRLLIEKLQPGSVFETCGCDVAVVTKLDVESDDIQYKSLTSGGEGACSLWHCAPVPLNEEEIKRRLDLFAEKGRKGLAMRYYMEDCKMSSEEADALVKQYNAVPE